MTFDGRVAVGDAHFQALEIIERVRAQTPKDASDLFHTRTK